MQPSSKPCKAHQTVLASLPFCCLNRCMSSCAFGSPECIGRKLSMAAFVSPTPCCFLHSQIRALKKCTSCGRLHRDGRGRGWSHGALRRLGPPVLGRRQRLRPGCRPRVLASYTLNQGQAQAHGRSFWLKGFLLQRRLWLQAPPEIICTGQRVALSGSYVICWPSTERFASQSSCREDVLWALACLCPYWAPACSACLWPALYGRVGPSREL